MTYNHEYTLKRLLRSRYTADEIRDACWWAANSKDNKDHEFLWGLLMKRDGYLYSKRVGGEK